MDMSKTEVMATAGAVEIPAARIDQGLERLTHSLKLLRAEGPDRDWAIAALPHLTTPADGGKLAVLCAALLRDVSATRAVRVSVSVCTAIFALGILGSGSRGAIITASAGMVARQHALRPRSRLR